MPNAIILVLKLTYPTVSVNDNRRMIIELCLFIKRQKCTAALTLNETSKCRHPQPLMIQS